MKRIMMYKKLFLVLIIGLLLGCPFQSFAQRDTEFWFAAPNNTPDGSTAFPRDYPVLVRISTFNEESRIFLSQPANPAFAPIENIIPPNTTLNITLANSRAELDGIECRPAGEIVPYGFLLQATTPVTAYLENNSAGNPDIYTFKGRNALGMEFIVPAQRTNNQSDGWNAIANTFLVVASQDDTHIDITPSRHLVGGHLANQTFSIVLQKGEVFVAQATSRSANNHLSGSLIVADKNISVMVNDDSVDSDGGPDLMGDQSIPIEMLGQTHIVAKGNFSSGENIYVHGAYDNTKIYLDGNSTAAATINKGDLYTFQLNNTSTFIESDHPVLVYHMSGWVQPGGAVIPPIECTGSNIIAFTRSSTANFYMMVFTQAGHEGDFLVNSSSTLLVSSDFSDVPGTGGAWKAARKNMTSQIPSGVASIVENTSGLFHLGIINGDNNSCRYGFFSNFASLNLGPDIAYCKGDTVLLDAGTGMDSYAWYKYTAPSIVISTEPTIEVSDTGQYFCVATYEMCTPSDTIHLSWHADPMPNLGPDTTACLGTPVVFYPGTFSAYQWFDGSTSSTLSCDTAKVIWVKVFDSFGCHNSDTVEMFLYPQPAPVPIFHD